MKKFSILFLEEAYDFLNALDDKTREKIIYNIDKASVINDPALFKKLMMKYGSSEPNIRTTSIASLHFGTKGTSKIHSSLPHMVS
jgi:hypothetical protein